jgi:multidrug resistance efflux pump
MSARSRRRVVTTAIAIVVLSLVGALAFRYWYEPTYDFVEVTDAQVTGHLTYVGAPAAGKIEQLYFNLGDTVHTGDTVAAIQVVAAGAGLPAVGPTITRVLAEVTSPVDGQVVAQPVSVGDTMNPGEPIVAISDIENLWVTANIDEARIGEVVPGQNVDITLANLGRTLHGKVAEVATATTEVINPAATGAFSSTDTTKKIPVRISVDWAGTRPAQGMTADVTIHFKQGASLAYSHDTVSAPNTPGGLSRQGGSSRLGAAPNE